MMSLRRPRLPYPVPALPFPLPYPQLLLLPLPKKMPSTLTKSQQRILWYPLQWISGMMTIESVKFNNNTHSSTPSNAPNNPRM